MNLPLIINLSLQVYILLYLTMFYTGHVLTFLVHVKDSIPKGEDT